MDYIKNRFAIPAVFLPWCRCPARLAFGWCDSPAKVITNLCKSPLMTYRKSMHKAATSYRNLCINPTESAELTSHLGKYIWSRWWGIFDLPLWVHRSSGPFFQSRSLGSEPESYGGLGLELVGWFPWPGTSSFCFIPLSDFSFLAWSLDS